MLPSKAELVDLLAGGVEIGNHHGLHGVALEGAEADVLQQGGGVLDLQVDAQVRLVGAVSLHGIPVGDAPEGSLAHPLVEAEGLKHGLQHRLQHAQHVVLLGKGHLHVQLVELAGSPVAPGVLIPEAGSDLEIAIKAGGHQQLLELLGSLGQSVELAGVLSGGHQIVPGAFGRGGGQDGGGDLQEALLGHAAADVRHHLAAQDDVFLHGGVAQVQEAVLQAGGLVRVPAAVDLKGQLVVAAAAQDLHLFGDDLDIAGGLLGVFAGPFPDGAGHGDRGFLVDGAERGYHLFGLRHHLGGAVKVPHHGKSQVAAHHAQVFQPACDLDLFARVFQAKLPTGMGTILHHFSILLPYSLPLKGKAASAVSRRADDG